MNQARVIKRYSNRKLYDCAESRYVSLDHIADLIRAGLDISVVDHETGRDTTRLVLTQVLYEQQKHGHADEHYAGIVQALVKHMKHPKIEQIVNVVKEDARRAKALMRRLQQPSEGVRHMLESAQARVRELQDEVERLRRSVQLLESKLVLTPENVGASRKAGNN